MGSWRQLPIVMALSVLSMGAPAPARAQNPGTPLHGSMPLVTQNDALREALARIERGSASWRQALADLAVTGRQAVVLTPDQVVVRDLVSGSTASFDTSLVAEVSPVADERGNVTTVLVVVNVARMQRIHDLRGSLPAEFQADLDRVLAHEVYGHAVPYLMAGHLSGRCADPERGQAATDSCAIQRENVVRRELRLGRRTDAALGSLALAWAQPH